MYPPGYQLQSQRVQAAYRYGDISFCHCIIDHTFWKVLFPILEYRHKYKNVLVKVH